jgi:hypothetical protein
MSFLAAHSWFGSGDEASIASPRRRRDLVELSVGYTLILLAV